MVCKDMNAATRSSLSDLAPLSSHEGYVICMFPAQVRSMMSSSALELLRSRWEGNKTHFLGGLSLKQKENLEHEVKEGMCDIVKDVSDRILRIVCLVSLRLERTDGTILVQLGNAEQNSMVPAVELPSAKITTEEVPRDALKKFCADFSVCRAAFTIFKEEIKVVERVSRSYGLRTRYIQTIFYANFDAMFEFTSSLPRNRPSEFDMDQAIILRSKREPQKALLLSWMPPRDFEVLSSNCQQAESLLQSWLPEWTDESSYLGLRQQPLEFWGKSYEELDLAAKRVQREWRERYVTGLDRRKASCKEPGTSSQADHKQEHPWSMRLVPANALAHPRSTAQFATL